jgi:hypothetical protein
MVAHLTSPISSVLLSHLCFLVWGNLLHAREWNGSRSRFFGIDNTFEWIKQLDIILISVEYRLAPEFPDPAPVEDCYAGLKWVGGHTSELGINPEKIMVAGHSAGGGLLLEQHFLYGIEEDLKFVPNA